MRAVSGQFTMMPRSVSGRRVVARAQRHPPVRTAVGALRHQFLEVCSESSVVVRSDAPHSHTKEHACRVCVDRCRRFGRKGKGPGEITFLMNMLRCGDSLVTLDFNANRVSVLGLDGTVGRVFRLKQLPYRASCNARMQFLFMDVERNPSGKKVVNRPLLPDRKSVV